MGLMMLFWNRLILAIALVGFGVVCQRVGAGRPDVVVILCDDLGYGDVQCFNPKSGRIATPNVNRLASQGMRFFDAHSGSSVCTPTRYGLLTGRYAWRTRLQKGVATGFAPCLIDADRLTLPRMLQQHGYHTAMVGKWHLDFQYADPNSGKTLRRRDHKLPPVGTTIIDGPIHRGFDEFLGFHHAREMRAVIRDDRVIEHDAVETMLPRLKNEAIAFIERATQTDQPYFLYLALNSPHTPIVPTEPWRGKSGLGDYADFVMQTDHVVGRVIDAIDRGGHGGHGDRGGRGDDTMIVFTSDNGCSKAAGIAKLAAQGHLVSGPLRGSKADLWEGGHRVPTIVRWPSVVAKGSQCRQTICLVDTMATVADILDHSIGDDAAEDSVSFLPALRGEPIPTERSGIVHHSVSGHFGYRSGDWKLLLARGSGGWSSPKENQVSETEPSAQIYHLSNDLSETHNRYSGELDDASKRSTSPPSPAVDTGHADSPDAAGLLNELETIVRRGRSTPGPRRPNDVETIQLWKSRK